MVFWNAGIEIAVFSAMLALISRVLQIRFGNRKAMNEAQSRMKEKQKQWQELMKKEDAKSKMEAEHLQNEIMGELNATMASNMRVMVISMVVFLPALWALGVWYNGITISAPFSWFVFHRAPGFPGVSIDWSSQFNWFSWYFWWALLTSIVLTFVFKKLKLE